MHEAQISTRSATIKSRDGYAFTSPVRAFRPNAFGLFDMYGNVCEWCADWYDPEYYAKSPANDPAGPPAGAMRVNRGGCWGSAPAMCRSASRHSHLATARHCGIDFRAAASADTAASADK